MGGGFEGDDVVAVAQTRSECVQDMSHLCWEGLFQLFELIDLCGWDALAVDGVHDFPAMRCRDCNSCHR